MDLRKITLLPEPRRFTRWLLCSTFFGPYLYRLALSRFWLVLFVVIASGCWTGSSSIVANQLEDAGDDRSSLGLRARLPPLILLTGFEPFGPGRPPNSSWEGIRGLDGTQWKGYRLVCKRLPVIWGAPLNRLRSWIDELQPTAVLSFGQGLPGRYSLETRASNRRGRHRDNNHDEPPSPTTVLGGPKEFRASTDASSFVTSLSQRGYPVQTSIEAGNYLCEENLYCLEYLKSTNNSHTEVMFFHVPPLETRIRDRPVTAEAIQQFVMDVLETWHEIDPIRTSVQPVTETAQDPNAAADQRGQPDEVIHREVEQFIEHYFRTWSEQDIDAYGKCFWPNSDIQFIASNGDITRHTLSRFLASQRDAHRRSRHRQTEVAESIEIRFEAKLARAVVYWKLTAGPRVEYGYDHFTLMKKQGKWGIVNLVFYASK